MLNITTITQENVTELARNIDSAIYTIFKYRPNQFPKYIELASRLLGYENGYQSIQAELLKCDAITHKKEFTPLKSAHESFARAIQSDMKSLFGFDSNKIGKYREVITLLGQQYKDYKTFLTCISDNTRFVMTNFDTLALRMGEDRLSPLDYISPKFSTIADMSYTKNGCLIPKDLPLLIDNNLVKSDSAILISTALKITSKLTSLIAEYDKRDDWFMIEDWRRLPLLPHHIELRVRVHWDSSTNSFYTTLTPWDTNEGDEEMGTTICDDDIKNGNDCAEEMYNYISGVFAACNMQTPHLEPYAD
tara:strand:+ start:194 stop:1108 length:915 start_codon:yes stop_codon:yes gene_type:complete